MPGFYRRLRHVSTCAAFAAVTAFALVPSADAQWFPFGPGAAPPGEIVQRLRAEGYVLVRPLERRDTVYLAEVTGGPAGRERLVIDAWSGEILQRFVARRGSEWPGGYVPEGGEFNAPPPLGPPPARDFREGNYGYGSAGPPGGFEAPPRARARSRPGATARKGGEPKQTVPAGPAAQPAEPQNARTGSPGAAPAAAAPTGAAGAPATAASPPAAPANAIATEPAKAEPSPANASSKPTKEAQPMPDAAPSSPAAAQTQAKGGAPPSGPKPAIPPAPAEKPSEKKVNDVPVNPLD